MLTALGGLIGQAFERARLYDTAYSQAHELQRGMLPSTLPVRLAVSAAARFIPAGGTAVGGDWYDVLPLSAGRVALVVGDVMGHGLPEAATMGRLRTAVSTLAGIELPPDELLAHLNDLVTGLGDAYYATCLYAVYDPVTGMCTVARAGHPPPAIVHTDGTVHFPDSALNPPLGVATPPFETAEFPVPSGALLVLYTDGLIESRDRDFDHGMARLAETLTAAVASHPPGAETDLDALCDTVTQALRMEKQAGDDAALLIARVCHLTRESVACWQLPDGAVAAGRARELVREQLAAWHLDELSMTSELLVSELVGNVIRHARGPAELRLLRSDVLVCEVSDGSLTTPHIRRAAETDEGGRGLQLVEALSHRWGARYGRTGKCIWAEQLLPSQAQPSEGLPPGTTCTDGLFDVPVAESEMRGPHPPCPWPA
ncbi:ATP-binding SpoIIE family protein phosphatase [Streptomyces sp. S465]|uniref:ATP-binding SpoIIE family protein phosphatase n=1 Tax=Streptomyces sp. S465 TaxID=2979468 RepID=UPI0022A82862|nr:ATP-binding SpoIIE family protein phosphatase [Streptomyces sp. S465]WAP54998.1 serine/threonine-protein phosphatase [Streptomyces sp. S465]